MDQFERNIKESITDVMIGQKPKTDFNKIWNKIDNNKKLISNRRRYALPVIVVATFMVLFTAGFASYQNAIRKVDKTDYPFVDDQSIIGKWKTVDFVWNMEEFTPGQLFWGDKIYLKNAAFIKDGNMLVATDNNNLAFWPSTWTNGKILNKSDQTSSEYLIKEIDDKQYMFMQWKNGDYTFKGAKPGYYVLEKEDNLDYSNYEPKAVKQDKQDYPFESDEQMLGTWEGVDMVKNIEDFKPGIKSWGMDLESKTYELLEDGKIKNTVDGKEYYDVMSWTKGLIMNKNNKTTSKCIIKEIEGNTYMFYEAKGGDYVYREQDPYYYVFKKVN